MAMSAMGPADEAMHCDAERISMDTVASVIIVISHDLTYLLYQPSAYTFCLTDSPLRAVPIPLHWRHTASTEHLKCCRWLPKTRCAEHFVRARRLGDHC